MCVHMCMCVVCLVHTMYVFGLYHYIIASILYLIHEREPKLIKVTNIILNIVDAYNKTVFKCNFWFIISMAALFTIRVCSIMVVFCVIWLFFAFFGIVCHSFCMYAWMHNNFSKNFIYMYCSVTK